MKTFLKLFVLLAIVMIVLSAVFSHQVYRFYITTYYGLRKIDQKQVVIKAKKLYKQSRYMELEGYLEKTMIVFPENAAMQQIAGLNLIKLGKSEKGAALILGSLRYKELPASLLDLAVDILFKKQMYGDIVGFLKQSKSISNKTVLKYFGISLSKQGQYKMALPVLVKAYRYGERSFAIHLYLGAIYSRLGYKKNAMQFLQAAFKMNKRDKQLRNELIDIYRKAGMYNKVHQLMQLKRY